VRPASRRCLNIPLVAERWSRRRFASGMIQILALLSRVQLLSLCTDAFGHGLPRKNPEAHQRISEPI
jgi:hypothetical protein